MTTGDPTPAIDPYAFVDGRFNATFERLERLERDFKRVLNKADIAAVDRERQLIEIRGSHGHLLGQVRALALSVEELGKGVASLTRAGPIRPL